jgi:hypothetical protein
VGGTQGTCLDCALTPPCVDTTSSANLDCEDGFTGPGAGGTASECLAVLGCDLGVTPRVTDEAPPITNIATTAPLVAYCGTTAFPACENGSTPPNGGCLTQVVAGFPAGTSPASIGGNIASGPYASSRAGKIITCLINNCPQCTLGPQ